MSNIFDIFRQIEKKSPGPMPPVGWIVVGLGNPGSQYEQTRHNNGFMALDLFAAKHNVKVNEGKFHALCARIVVSDVGVLLMKPQTFMNNSGVAVKEAVDFYKTDPSHVLVFSDDISLDVGRIRIRKSGSAGGHNGLKSIIAMLGGDSFPRVKIGTGNKPHPDYDLADWVLGRYGKEDFEKLSAALDHAADAAELVIRGQIEEAMNKFNRQG